MEIPAGPPGCSQQPRGSGAHWKGASVKRTKATQRYVEAARLRRWGKHREAVAAEDEARKAAEAEGENEQEARQAAAGEAEGEETAARKAAEAVEAEALETRRKAAEADKYEKYADAGVEELPPADTEEPPPDEEERQGYARRAAAERDGYTRYASEEAEQMAGAPTAPLASEGETLAAELEALAKSVSEGETNEAGEALEQMLGKVPAVAERLRGKPHAEPDGDEMPCPECEGEGRVKRMKYAEGGKGKATAAAESARVKEATARETKRFRDEAVRKEAVITKTQTDNKVLRERLTIAEAKLAAREKAERAVAFAETCKGLLSAEKLIEADERNWGIIREAVLASWKAATAHGGEGGGGPALGGGGTRGARRDDVDDVAEAAQAFREHYTR